MNKLIDRYWELRREIINTPPIYFWKLKKLFREYKEVKEKIESFTDGTKWLKDKILICLSYENTKWN